MPTIRIRHLSLLFLLPLFFVAVAYSSPHRLTDSDPSRRVNAPYFPGNDIPSISRRAVFWFGQVDLAQNYVDGRVGYNDAALYIAFHVFDHELWSDPSPEADELKAWDAVSLFLDLSGAESAQLTDTSYRFVNALHNRQDDTSYQSTARGNGGIWTFHPLTVTTDTFWRGEGLNDNQSDRGWVALFEIPFSTLGLAGPPAAGTLWGMAVAMHDRDDRDGSTLSSTVWPETADNDAPVSWGELRFGVPTTPPPSTSPSDTTTIRHGLGGLTVEDAHVGGHSDCGRRVDPHFFASWGNLNYAGYEQVNIQNQWDVADWPCFSKFYITFPLVTLPSNSDVISATLTLRQFGNARPEEALKSFIQVLEVRESWDEATITWNNAPLAVQNLDVTTVAPIPGGVADWPGIPYDWDVTGAVARAHAAGEPVRLVLYSSDGAYHSGKYFSSSDVGEWNEVARPTLTIAWSNRPAPTPEPAGEYLLQLPVIRSSRGGP